MIAEIIAFSNTEIERYKFRRYKNPIFKRMQILITY